MVPQTVPGAGRERDGHCQSCQQVPKATLPSWRSRRKHAMNGWGHDQIRHCAWTLKTQISKCHEVLAFL